ncbi:hypothetical protein SGPA1_30869 [Streptomyces misionensis JCM 4497]
MPGLHGPESSMDGTIEQLCQARHTPGVSLRFDRRCAPAVRRGAAGGDDGRASPVHDGERRGHEQ